MNVSPRCLFNSDFSSFLYKDIDSVFGALCDNYHGDALTTTREAWKSEIEIMRDVIYKLNDQDGQIIFEYDIPRLGKRIDLVLLYRGIVFCIEFKVGESRILEGDIDQVLDYALDLKNFHKFSQDKVIVPILVATNFPNSSTDMRCSARFLFCVFRAKYPQAIRKADCLLLYCCVFRSDYIHAKSARHKGKNNYA